MDDRLARHMLENNILKRQLSIENRVALLEKLGLINPNNLPQPGENLTDCCVVFAVPTLFDGERTGFVDSIGLLIHDAVAGLCYSLDFFSTASPHWVQWDTGLTTTQNQVIDKVRVGQDGTVMVGEVTTAGANTFLAYAPRVGGSFTVIENFTSISAKYGGSTDNLRVAAFNFNPLTNEWLYCLTQAGENIRTYIGSGVTYTAGATFACISNNGTDVSFGGDSGGNWLFTATGAVILSSDASSVVRSESIGPYYLSRHLRLGVTGDTIMWDDDSLVSGLALATGADNVNTVVNNIGQDWDSQRLYEDRLASDPTGQYLMGRNATPAPVRSADGGVTKTVMSALPSTVSWYFVYVGGSGTSSQWVAVGANKIFYSPNFGTTWIDKLGDLTDIVAIPLLNVVKLIGGSSQKVCVDYTQTEALQISVSTTNPLAVHITGALIPTLTGHAIVQTTDPDIDLSSHIPASGLVRLVGIQIDSVGALTVVDGTPFDANDTPTTANLPIAEPGKVIRFFVILYAGIEELCPMDFAVPAPMPMVSAGVQINDADADIPLEADKFGFWDVVDSALKSITWANIKATLKTYFDTLYAVIGHTHTITTRWEPLANGDPGDPQIVFDGTGNVIMVEVEI